MNGNNTKIISQEMYNDLKLKADLCMRFKKSAEDALDVAREAQEMAGRLIDDNTKLVEENTLLKEVLGLKELSSNAEGIAILKELLGNATFKTEEKVPTVSLEMTAAMDMNTLSAKNGLRRGVCSTAFSSKDLKKECKVVTNAEKYKNELEWLEEVCAGTHSGIGFSLAVLKDTGNPANCYDISCDDCAFCRFDDKSPYAFMGCSECREYWLQQATIKEDK